MGKGTEERVTLVQSLALYCRPLERGDVDLIEETIDQDSLMLHLPAK